MPGVRTVWPESRSAPPQETPASAAWSAGGNSRSPLPAQRASRKSATVRAVLRALQSRPKELE